MDAAAIGPTFSSLKEEDVGLLLMACVYQNTASFQSEARDPIN